MSERRKRFRIRHADRPEKADDVGVVWNPRFARCGDCSDFPSFCKPTANQSPASRKCLFWGREERGRHSDLNPR